jgi:hypothetical protein
VELQPGSGTTVASGCENDGMPGAPCVLGCQEGFVRVVGLHLEGQCTVQADGTAAYIGQGIECRPETTASGGFSAAYCLSEAPEVVSSCCQTRLTADDSRCGGSKNLPSSCSSDCADRWLPLWQDCEANLGEFSPLTTLCEETAEHMLANAPSSLEISGLQCNNFANGVSARALTVFVLSCVL